ncbi:MAG: hypothetical protein EPO26_17135 [Chloroflexota bacterium]|nr:MAG: hypothetical protein EPO26_17135 [Chloroflexota bacterium]
MSEPLLGETVAPSHPFDGPVTVTRSAGKNLPGGASLVAELTVQLVQEEGLYSVTSEALPLFGEGDTASDALSDFLGRLAPHLAWLESLEEDLEPGMADEFATLRRHVTRP